MKVILFNRLRKRLRNRLILESRMKKNKPSILSVAHFAGVSTATVSHVINGTRFVTEETAQKVKTAIEELGYFPSTVARGLASQQSKTVGIVFSDISNPFFTSVYKAIEYQLTLEGYELMLANTAEMTENQEKVLRTMLARQIDGLIIAPTGQKSEMLTHILNSNIPVVCIDRGGPYEGVSLVEIDNVKAAYEAVAHLIEDGHRKIGIITGIDDVGTTMSRLEGFEKALRDYQIPSRAEYQINGDSRMKSGYQAFVQLMQLEDPPSAIFTTNNLMTSGALHAVKDLKLRCPHDIALIGFDDHDWGDIFTPPLTVIRQPTEEMGQLAAKILIENMDHLQVEHHTLQGQLIIRGSCSEKCLPHV